MDRALELDHINAALYLEEILLELEKDENELDGSKPEKPVLPQEPKLIIGNLELEPYPSIEAPSVSFPLWTIVGLTLVVVVIFVSPSLPTVIGAILGYLLIPVIPISILADHWRRKEKKRLALEKARNSPEYKEQCRKIAQENDLRAQQAKQAAQLEYEKALKKYHEETLPQYEEGFNNYKDILLPQWNERRKNLLYAKTKIQDALSDVYDQNIIPGKYRNYEALTFISAFMGTSQYDLKFAIEQYNDELHARNEQTGLDYAKAQKDILQHTLEVAEYKEYLAEQTSEMIQNGNKTLRSLRRWTIASTALQGYANFKQNRLIKSIKPKN